MTGCKNNMANNKVVIDVSKLKWGSGETIQVNMEVMLPPVEGALEGTDNGKEEGISFSEPASLSLDVTNTGQLFLVKGNVRAELILTCVRCLEPYTMVVETVLNETYFQKEKAGELKELDEEYISFTGDSIDITPEVLKAIILELPMKMLCNPDCKGLCPGCGRNLNEGNCQCVQDTVDPRLGILKELLEKK